jgi:hypothetical protein
MKINETKKKTKTKIHYEERKKERKKSIVLMVSFVCENNNRRKEGRKSGVVEMNPREEKSILWGCEEKVCF